MMAENLIRDDRGATTVEIAFVLPVLILFIYGIFVIGLIFQANAGMQHALGEGARLANIYPAPTDAVIQARMDQKAFYPPGGTFTSFVNSGSGIGSGCNPPSGSTNYKTLKVTFTMPVNFIFFSAPNLSLSRCKTVYTAT